MNESNNDSADVIAKLRAAGEPTRLRLLALCSRGEQTVSDLVLVLELSQPRISRHLKILCDAGLLERFRDGHFVYFRVPLRGIGGATAKQLLALVDSEDETLRADRERLVNVLAPESTIPKAAVARELNRAVLDCFLSVPVGELLDVGVGSGAMLKLLSTRAERAVGIDIDNQSRQTARREMLLAGLVNCKVRPGNMYRLTREEDEFDTVLLDEVLHSAERPAEVLSEARRVLRSNGHLLIIEKVRVGEHRKLAKQIGALLAAAKLRISTYREVSGPNGCWVVISAESVREQAQAGDA